jgi:hypothetical protein
LICQRLDTMAEEIIAGMPTALVVREVENGRLVKYVTKLLSLLTWTLSKVIHSLAIPDRVPGGRREEQVAPRDHRHHEEHLRRRTHAQAL